VLFFETKPAKKKKVAEREGGRKRGEGRSAISFSFNLLTGNLSPQVAAQREGKEKGEKPEGNADANLSVQTRAARGVEAGLFTPDQIFLHSTPGEGKRGRKLRRKKGGE